ncbi:MAG: ABC transporter permease [Limnochordia bacterium]|nr:ABC transporter permease [Limnochordia bacterium]MDD2629797.1 ABC transporter permease [Limnochordia bacterium]
MNGTRQIMMWEIMRNLRNKQFLLGLILTPLIIVVFAGIPLLIEKLEKPEIDTYVVFDELGLLGTLVQLTESSNIEVKGYDGEDLAGYAEEIKAKGYFTLTESFIETGSVTVHMEKPQGIEKLQALLTALLQNTRIQQSGIDPNLIQRLSAPCQVIPAYPNGDAAKQARNMLVSMVLTILVVILILATGGMLLYSALQEKRDRMAEVVLSSISPLELMQGKILGNFVLGVIQFGLWLLLGVGVAKFGFHFPVEEYIVWQQLPVLLVFGLLGYLLYASLFVGLGATMEDVQSAGSLQGLAFALPSIGAIFIGPVIQNPDGMIATIVSLFPFTSPWIVMMRSGLTVVPLWELLLSAGILLITTVLVMFAAAKIFRVGMLMYGKTATPKEIWKWFRYE